MESVGKRPGNRKEIIGEVHSVTEVEEREHNTCFEAGVGQRQGSRVSLRLLTWSKRWLVATFTGEGNDRKR